MCFNDHQECKVRPYMININNIEPLFYACIILVNIPVEVVIILMIHICVPDVIKCTNIKVFKLMSRTNETRHVLIYRKIISMW